MTDFPDRPIPIQLDYASPTTRTRLLRFIGVFCSLSLAVAGALLCAFSIAFLVMAVMTRRIDPALMALAMAAAGSVICYFALRVQQRLVLPAI